MKDYHLHSFSFGDQQVHNTTSKFLTIRKNKNWKDIINPVTPSQKQTLLTEQ